MDCEIWSDWPRKTLSVGQLRYVLAGLLDLPAAGRCELDPVAEIETATTRRLRCLGGCGLGFLSRWLPSGLRGRLLGRRYGLARGDRDIRLLTAASPVSTMMMPPTAR